MVSIFKIIQSITRSELYLPKPNTLLEYSKTSLKVNIQKQLVLEPAHEDVSANSVLFTLFLIAIWGLCVRKHSWKSVLMIWNSPEHFHHSRDSSL